ncbi:MAG: TrkH family potassium uptake protein [Bacteroidota bacterium]
MASSNRVNLSVIFKVAGILLVIEGFFMLSCLGFSFWDDPYSYSEFRLFNPRQDFFPLFVSGLGTATLGMLLWYTNRSPLKNAIGKREGYLLISISWLIISFFGTLPYLLSGVADNFTDAFFEAMSGFTTTGATVFNNVEIIPKGLLFWRAITQWLGGMTIIFFSLAVLPFLGIGGGLLFISESPGFSPEKLHPRIIETLKRLWLIYLSFTLILTFLLILGGMTLFDALCHAFSTVSTGGFSTKNESITVFPEFIRYVIAVFMLMAGIGSTVQYFVFTGQWRKAFLNEEVRYYLSFILLSIIVCTVALSFLVHDTFGPVFGESVFQVISIISTTGFVTADYLQWPSFLWMFFFLLMFTGACAGSAGGGVKMVRILLLLKNSTHELKRLVHPQAIIPVRLNGRYVGEESIFNVLAFFLIYIIVFAGGSLVMSLIGLEFYTAIGTTAACIGNIGPGLGSVGPMHSYAAIPDAGKWTLSFLMLIGRLEFLTVFILFSRTFWKK